MGFYRVNIRGITGKYPGYYRVNIWGIIEKFSGVLQGKYPGYKAAYSRHGRVHLTPVI